MNIHPVFHVLLLELYIGSNQIEDATSSVLVENKKKYEMDQVLNSRFHYCRLQYLVK